METFTAEHARKLRKALEKCQSILSKELGMAVCFQVGNVTYDKSQLRFPAMVQSQCSDCAALLSTSRAHDGIID